LKFQILSVSLQELFDNFYTKYLIVILEPDDSYLGRKVKKIFDIIESSFLSLNFLKAYFGFLKLQKLCANYKSDAKYESNSVQRLESEGKRKRKLRISFDS
jgi:hypothetical protein